jgi:Uncharacterized integral membrane protein
MHEPERPHPRHRVVPLTSLEARISRWIRPKLPAFAYEFLTFGFKQAWACLYAAVMLAMIVGTKLIWNPDWPVARYDFLTVAAVLLQLLLLELKLETPREALVILIYHVVGTIMEIFKTEMGSWAYPEPSALRIGGVPLFTGFMYACVGSYMVRAIRLFDMRFAPYPPFWMTAALAFGIYLNFFAHHYIFDFRYLLMAATLLLFARTPHLVHARREDFLDAAAARGAPDSFFPLDRGEYRHFHRHLALPEPEDLAPCGIYENGLVVSAAVPQLRVGDAGSPA